MNTSGLFYIFLYVSDLERSRKFYGETLGWQPGMVTDEVAGFNFGSTHLVIHRDNRTSGHGEYGGGCWLAVQVDDVDAVHRELTARGVKVGRIFDQHWGERMFYLDDPDGYHWSIGHPTRA